MTLEKFYAIYLALISLLAVIMVVRDKVAADKSVRCVKEWALLAVSAFGGSAAMLVTMLAVRRKIRRAKFMIGIPLIILVQVAVFVFVFDSRLAVGYYSIDTDKIDGQIKLSLVTDFHACDYGDGQRELLDAIDEQQPDAVLMCGDIFDDRIPADNAVELIKGVTAKYPCYYVTGNHEYWYGNVSEFKDILVSCGVKVLEGTAEVFEVSGEKIIISGIDDPDVDGNYSPTYSEQLTELAAIADNEMFTVLLSHRPERINEFLTLKPNLVLSGHAHGGQWRIPVILENGLYAPDQGLFPKYTSGEYFFGETELIVSRGLARETTPLPRIFNRPELVIITLQ